MTFLLPRTIPVLQTVCDLHEILRSFKYAGVILCTRRLNLIANLSYSKRTSGRKPLTMSECIRDSPFQPTSACLRSRYQHARRGRDRPSAGRKKSKMEEGGEGGAKAISKRRCQQVRVRCRCFYLHQSFIQKDGWGLGTDN